jgi:hypothetical protein
MEPLVLECPHCQDLVFIEKKDINCAIFRHAIFKNSFEPIPPHSSKEHCDDLLDRKLVYGCAKPFQLVFENNTFTAKICDYL